jgi:hypothetical protein
MNERKTLTESIGGLIPASEKVALVECIKAAQDSGRKVLLVDGQMDDRKTLIESIKDQFGRESVILADNSELRERGNTSAKKAWMATAAIMAFTGMSPWAFAKRRKVKEMQKCRLPGCETMHSHNGGYCSSEHCLKHRKIIKEKANLK